VFVSPSFSRILAYVCTEHILVRYKICALPVKKPNFARNNKTFNFFQLYVLKLLKMQTKYLGRQWRKSNMKTMSAIYTKVRHRLNDDWAYGNGIVFTLRNTDFISLLIAGYYPCFILKIYGFFNIDYLYRQLYEELVVLTSLKWAS
jgi:hypothetical protein